jgi:hypothetical protein
MHGKDWQNVSMISLAGVYTPKEKIEESKIPKALVTYLKSHPYIEKIYLHLDSDYAGRLGLIDFSNNILINNCDYDNIIKSEFINDMILNNKYFKNSHVMLSHQMNFIFKNHYYKFNEFGCDFIKTCIL